MYVRARLDNVPSANAEEVVEEASPEADPEVAPVVKKPKRKYYGKPKAAAVKK